MKFLIFISMRKDILEREKEIADWISMNKSKSFMCGELKCKPVTLNSWLSRMVMIIRVISLGRGVIKGVMVVKYRYKIF